MGSYRCSHDLLFRGSGCGRPLRLPPPDPLGQRQPDAMARHGVTAIEVSEHEGSRIRVRHDHLGISDAKTGSNNGPGRARANAGT
jgi:hypothetical protein